MTQASPVIAPQHNFIKSQPRDMKNPYKIEYCCSTPLLLLKPFTLSMAESFSQQANDSKVQATDINFLLPFTVEHAQEAIRRYINEWNQQTCYYFALHDSNTQQFMGAISLRFQPEHEVADMGYWLGSAFWNKGYATLAAREMVKFAFIEFGIQKLYAQHMSHNPASGRVMQKMGMTQEGVLRSHWLKEEKRYDLVMYGLLRSEFLAQYNGV